MELNQFTDFSLRTLIFVAVCEEELTSVKAVAGAFGISENHLVKVVHKLSVLGYLNTFRGRSGGFTLAREASMISVGEVIRAVEPLSIVECFSEDGACCIKGVCALELALYRAREAFLNELDQLTIADLALNRNALLARLRGA